MTSQHPEPSGNAPTAPAPTTSSWDATKILIVGLVAAVAFLVGAVGSYFITQGSSHAADPTSQTGAAQSDTSADPDPQASSQATATDASAYSPSLTDSSALALVRSEPTRDPDDTRAVGDADAPVVMVSFSDYSCPMCARFAQDTEPGLQDLIDAGTLRIEYRDFVIFQDYGSDLAAAGARAAANQGKFIDYHRAVFAAADPDGHATYTEDSVVDLARTAGVGDLDRFRADLTSQTTKDEVTEETTRAQQMGITGTPFFMVNDTAFSGAQPLSYVRATIENQLQVAPYQE